MIIAERDACIAEHLKLGQLQANRVTMALGTTSDFTRGSGTCVDCDMEMVTTRH